MDNSPKISVVICTYNRSDLLQMAIQSVCDQTANITEFELIVVDNNSSDNTSEIVANFSALHSNIKYIKELNQGLSYARNRGYAESLADYVAYLDDDAKANSNWVEKAIKLIETYEPDAFGGPIYPYYLTQKPDWFKDEYQTFNLYDYTGLMKKEHSLSGSNMIFKKEILQEFDGFSVNLGMKGNKQAYGEESDLIERLKDAGKKIYYDQKLSVLHLVPEHKLNPIFFLSFYYNTGKAAFSINPEEMDNSENDLLEHLQQHNKIWDQVLSESKDFLTGKSDLTAEQALIEKILIRMFAFGQLSEKTNQLLVRRNTLKEKIMRLNLEKIVNWFKKK